MTHVDVGDLFNYGSGHPQRRAWVGMKGIGSDSLVM